MIRDSTGLVCVLAFALAACSETSGTAGAGGGAGVGGVAGSGVGGGGGSEAAACLPQEHRCRSVEIEPHRSCCQPEVPDQANACDGTESLVNPATCQPTETSVVYKLTTMEVEEDCDVGYDLDACDGQTCVRGGLAPGEGLDGTDNALAGFGVILAGGGDNLGSLNKALSDLMCGMTDSSDAGTCESGDSPGLRCTQSSDCPGAAGTCNRADDDCLGEVAPLELRLAVDANFPEGCANIDLLVGGKSTSHVLNLSDAGCLSGALGTVSFEERDLYGSLHRAVVRMTISSAGFSHGLLGGAMDEEMSWAVFEIVFPGSADPLGSPFDLAISTSPPAEELAECDGFSAAFRIGGIAEDLIAP